MSQVLWLTGLPGSGKSAIADAFKAHRSDFFILRMDELRKIATPEASYSEQEREILYRALVFTARAISSLNHNTIIDATGNRRRWRGLARELIPHFSEIYITCPLEICMKREKSRLEKFSAPDNIYNKALRGASVPGINTPYEPPLNPELAVDSSTMPIEEIVSLIERLLI
ncbi:MAG: adenylyl-sulfate kinase [Nitrospirae bacterium]|nr:adenylyl-sulfate kinase [Nitrospirota bacterium]